MLFLCGCGEKKYTKEYLDVFDTYSTLTIYTNNKEDFEKGEKEVHNLMTKLNKKLDIYNSYDGMNNLKTINDNAGIKPVKVDKDIMAVIKAGKDAYIETDGNVNIALGAVLKIWHNYRENALNNGISALPTQEELEIASKHTDINSIIIDEENSTVYISDKMASIDIGAIAKGYAADRCSELLKEMDINSALINLGGNVIALTNDKKKSWKTGIVSPDNSTEYIRAFNLSNASAVTSGNYQRYYEYEGKKYHHIIDGNTLFPADSNKTVTVITESSLKGDIYSTALFITKWDKGIELAEKNGVKAMWITTSGEEHSTKDFPIE